jgi:hypothetical protein
MKWGEVFSIRFTRNSDGFSLHVGWAWIALIVFAVVQMVG